MRVVGCSNKQIKTRAITLDEENTHYASVYGREITERFGGTSTGESDARPIGQLLTKMDIEG